eukprot:sb/3477719/
MAEPGYSRKTSYISLGTDRKEHDSTIVSSPRSVNNNSSNNRTAGLDIVSLVEDSESFFKPIPRERLCCDVDKTSLSSCNLDLGECVTMVTTPVCSFNWNLYSLEIN